VLPAFHFHDERHADLEPKLRYLHENGYRTVTADEMGAFVRRERALGDRRVVLCFDDAWKSVWTDAAPLLEAFGFTAVVYAIPGRTQDEGESAFMTWPQLQSLQQRGTIDVQSHTFSHAKVFVSSRIVGFVTPDYASAPLLNRPQPAPAARFMSPDDLGAPLYEHRSRMSDGLRIVPHPAIQEACTRRVAAEGGTAFFERADWRQQLEATAQAAAAGGLSAAGELSAAGYAGVETPRERQAAIEDEIDRARAELTGRLGIPVRHICLPWGVSGVTTSAALARLGVETAFANRWAGVFAVSPGDHPHWLKRLPNRYIFRLPGRGRRWWFGAGAA
jgi:peptidoglycan/xylan/chitin deacetylase (PgdA/CDA1 family)